MTIIVRETSPGVFDPLAFSPSITGPDGANYPWQIVDLWSPIELETLGIFKLEPTPVPAGKVLVSYTIERVEGVVSYVPTFEDIPAPSPPTKQELAEYAAALRFQVEVGGVAWGEFVIQTDRESQSKMLAEFVAISAGLRTDPSPWKFADDKFATLSNTDMSAVCLAGREHVATAFATEETVQAAIEAGTITTTSEIDTAF